MTAQPRVPLGPQPWEVVRHKLDQALPFANMRGTPYYRDAVWEQFSAKEYARRYAALRDKMRAHKLDAVIAAGGPSHWSFGAGVLWLTGHVEWHALASYLIVPLDGEPTLVYSMGGTHAEAVRRQVSVAVQDVRHSRNGRYGEVMVERLKELKLEHGRIGLMEIDPRHEDYMPVNQYNALRTGLPDAEFVFTKSFLHELLVIHSQEELDCVRKAGVLCQRAMEAMVARAKPGDYFALLAYIARSQSHTESLQRIRSLVRQRFRVATCLGFGPRFLHSTGQAYKGGPNTGVFLQITAHHTQDLTIPRYKASFGIIEAAQARGDFEVLAERDRRALRVHFMRDAGAGLAMLADTVERALA